MAMTVSDEGIALIASFEGFSGTLYNDPSGNCTIGYGYLVHMGRCDGSPSEAPWVTGITQEQGDALLAQTVTQYADAVARLTAVPLTQSQFDALTSFTYNVGPGGYLNSSVRTVLNQGNYAGVCDELKKYIYGSDGVALPGLIRRRQAECNLYSREDAMTAEEKAAFDALVQAHADLQQQVTALANGADAVLKGALKYVWALAGKAWPWP